MAGRAWDGVRAAAGDRVSGAAEIALRGAEALASLPRTDLRSAVVALVTGHPSMAPLWRLGSDVLGAGDPATAAAAFARRLAAERDGVAARAAAVLAGTVVVHSYSGSVVAALVASGVRATCARSDPGGEGELTARRLSERGIEARLVDDERAVAEAARADAVVVGADAIGPGGVVNKIGTRRLAEASLEAGRPALVVAGSSKLVASDLPAPRPFERTPLSAFTNILTEEGALTPEEAARRASAFPLHPALEGLLEELG